jgi:DNA-binding GntR family transcriptional regulator
MEPLKRQRPSTARITAVLTELGGPRVPGSRRAQVVEILREAILTGELSPNVHLKQDQLCQRFGLSPAPVREALRDLESEGLVRHFPHRGVVVCDITPDELLGVLIPVRMAIECFALPRAAERMPDATWSALHAIVEEMGEAAQRADLDALNDLDVAFHEHAIKASDAEQALQLWRSVLPRIRLQFRRLAPLHAKPDAIVREHRELLEVLLRKDRETIVAQLQDHIVDSAARLLDAGPVA